MNSFYIYKLVMFTFLSNIVGEWMQLYYCGHQTKFMFARIDAPNYSFPLHKDRPPPVWLRWLLLRWDTLLLMGPRQHAWILASSRWAVDCTHHVMKDQLTFEEIKCNKQVSFTRGMWCETGLQIPFSLCWYTWVCACVSESQLN